LIDFDSDFEYVNSLNNPIQRVEEEDINDHFDRCESLLSDMESYGTRSNTTTPKLTHHKPVSSTKTNKIGMETIKRQMDNLTEMVILTTDPDSGQGLTLFAIIFRSP